MQIHIPLDAAWNFLVDAATIAATIFAAIAIPYQISLINRQRRQEREDRYIESLLDQFADIEVELLRINATLLKWAVPDEKEVENVKDFSDLEMLVIPFESKCNKLHTLINTFEYSIPESILNVARDFGFVCLDFRLKIRAKVGMGCHIRGNSAILVDVIQNILSTLKRMSELSTELQNAVKNLPRQKK